MGKVFTEDQTQYYDEMVNLPEGSSWLGTQMMPIHGKNGEVNAVLEISRDITTRKQVENELKNALQKEKEFNELQVNFVSMITHQLAFDGPDEQIVCLVDEHLIYYSLENLLTNAMKYSSSNSLIELHLWLEGGRIHIRVSDQGMGISPQDLSLVGNVFYRGKNATRIPGTGLGLAFVKRSMEAMQGTFAIRSQERVGTEVDLQLPYRPAALEDANSGGDA